MNERLNELRGKVDVIDEDIIEKLAERMKVVAEIGAHKKEQGLKPRDDERFESVVAKLRTRAEELNVPPDLVTEIYNPIHKFALEREAEA